MNRSKVVLVSAGLVLLGVILVYKQYKASKPKEDNANGDAPTDWNKILKIGSKGKEVTILQTALKQLKADGDFGQLTEARLKKVMGVTQVSLNGYNEFINKK